MTLRTTPLHPRFGVEVHGVDLATVSAAGFPPIRDAFERHSLLLFRHQSLDDEAHLRFGRLFGPIEVRAKGPDKPPAVVSPLTNVGQDGALLSERDRQVLNLKANQLWHTDSTFLPVPALINVLLPRTIPSKGGETEFATTRAAWADMPEALKARARNAVVRHRYAHSRAKIDPELAKGAKFTMWDDTRWRALWRNPVTGEDALYIASHAYAVEGLGEEEGRALIDELIAFATRPEYVYPHRWRAGDVLVWDERATLHRGRPWPYDEPRVMASICVTAQDSDGLASIRPPA